MPLTSIAANRHSDHAQPVTNAGTWSDVGLGTFGLLYAFGALLLLVAIPVAIARDMRRRGRQGWSYGLLTFLLFPVGVAAWLIDRHRFPVVE